MKKPYLMMPEMIIKSEFLLRDIKKSDYHDMFLYGRDEETTRYINWGPLKFPKEALETIKSIYLTRPKKKLPVGYAIVDIKKNQMIGTIDFHTRSISDNSCQIGFVLNKKYWNLGIISEALQRMVEVGFEYLGYDNLDIIHLKENTACESVLKKTDFKLIAVKEHSFTKKSMLLNKMACYYRLTKEDYYAEKS